MGRRAFSVSLLDGTSAFDSRILHQKGATCARGVLKFIHVVNNDTIVHDVHTNTVAVSTQSDQVWYLISSSLNAHTS